MQKQTLVVLTVEQAREALVEHYTDFYFSNRANLSNLIRDGKMDDFPNLKTSNSSQVLRLFRDNGLGKTVANTEKVSLVTIQVDGTLQVVYNAPVVAPAPNDSVLLSS